MHEGGEKCRREMRRTTAISCRPGSGRTLQGFKGFSERVGVDETWFLLRVCVCVNLRTCRGTKRCEAENVTVQVQACGKLWRYLSRILMSGKGRKTVPRRLMVWQRGEEKEEKLRHRQWCVVKGWRLLGQAGRRDNVLGRLRS